MFNGYSVKYHSVVPFGDFRLIILDVFELIKNLAMIVSFYLYRVPRFVRSTETDKFQSLFFFVFVQPKEILFWIVSLRVMKSGSLTKTGDVYESGWTLMNPQALPKDDNTPKNTMLVVWWSAVLVSRSDLFHVLQITVRKLNELSAKVLLHPPYFPDLSPTYLSE